MAPELSLGPLLRYAGETDATIWVETDACEIEVLGPTARTFEIEEAQVGTLVAQVQPGCRGWLHFATITHEPIPLSIMGLSARIALVALAAPLRVLRMGSRPSHLIF